MHLEFLILASRTLVLVYLKTGAIQLRLITTLTCRLSRRRRPLQKRLTKSLTTTPTPRPRSSRRLSRYGPSNLYHVAHLTEHVLKSLSWRKSRKNELLNLVQAPCSRTLLSL